MNKLPLPLTQLIHENLSVLMTFAFSRKELEKLIGENFKGEWKFLNKALFEVSEQRAAKALIEIASFIRLLDDQEEISGCLKQTGGHSFGLVVKKEKMMRLYTCATSPIK